MSYDRSRNLGNDLGRNQETPQNPREIAVSATSSAGLCESASPDKTGGFDAGSSGKNRVVPEFAGENLGRKS